MKRKWIFFTSMLLISNLFGQRSGGFVERYLEPFPSGETVGEYFIYAVGLLIVGFVLIKISDAFKAGDKETVTSTGAGCITSLLFFAAIICLIPLLSWLEVIFKPIIIVIFIGIAALALVALIWSKLWK